MADIKIYGRLVNATTDGEIAKASQVKDDGYAISGKANPTQAEVNADLKKKAESVNAATAAEIAKKQDKLVSGTNIKTVNGQSILGAGNVAIDLSLYKVVAALPATGIDVNKIYLVKSGTSGTNDVYTEYMYVEGKWEKFGTYTAAIDLAPYVKFTDLATAAKAGAMSAADKAKLDGLKNYALPKASDTALGGIKTGHPADNYWEAAVELDAGGKAFVNLYESIPLAADGGEDGGLMLESQSIALAEMQEWGDQTFVQDISVNNDIMPDTDKVTLNQRLEKVSSPGTSIAGTPAVIKAATATNAGVMKASDKAKLDKYAATFSQNPVATNTAAGLMSETDKSKLDGFEGALTDAEIDAICV